MKPSKTILIVEDEGLVAIDLQSRLLQMGYHVPEIFDNGNDLLKFGFDYQPDLIIMDVMIKGELDGIQTAQKFKEMLDVPIIFLTAYSDNSTFQRAKLSGAYAFLIKPFNQRELETTIEIAFFRDSLLKKISHERKQFFHILKNLKDAIIATNSRGYVIFYNDSANNLFEIDKHYSNPNQPIQELLPFVKTIPQNPNLIQDLLTGQIPQYQLDSLKITWYEKNLAFDLNLFPYHDDSSQVEGLIFVAHDVSEKLKFIEELQKSERRYRSLFERNLAGVVQEKMDGTIIHCNDAYAKIFGYATSDEIIGLNTLNFYHSPLERTALLELLKNVGFLKNVELYQKRKDGTPIWILQNIHITTLNNEKILEATVVDITAQKNIENQLKISQTNLLNLIEYTNIGIWSLNKNYELISFNSKYATLFFEIFGYYPKQGLNVLQLEDRITNFWKKFYQKAFEGKKFSEEILFKIRNKTYYFDVHFYPIYNLNQKVEAITIYANDITEKKLQEIEKQKSLDLLNAVFSQSGDGLAILDFQGNILNCNERLFKLLGFDSKKTFIEANLQEILIPKFYRKSVFKKILNQNDWHGEIFYEKDTLKAWLDVSFKTIKAGNDDLILVRVTDITEKIKAEEMRLLLETAIANTSDGVLILDNNTPPFAIYANDAYFKISQRNPDNFFGVPLNDLNQKLNLFPIEIQKKLNNKEPVKFEFENYRANGEPYVCDIGFTPIEFKDGKVYWLVILRDISERKKSEQELMEAKMNQQKLIHKTIVDTQEFERQRFAEDLHDSLGQMLSALKINIAALGSYLTDNTEIYVKSIDLLDSAIQELRTISHNLMPSSLEQLGLNSTLRELCKIMNSANKISIHYQCHGNEISIDKSYEITLYRVVQELLNNSFKHSNAQKIFLQLFYYPDSILLMYEDDGQGFDLQEIKHNSKGIGLKNMEHRIKLINGTIHFETEKGKGFLCTIEIPLDNI